MFRTKREPNDGVIQPDRLLFGILETYLYGCDILFKTKLNITEDVFGKMILFIQSLNSEGKSGAIFLIANGFL
jgi:hypothetical protein